MRRNLMNLGLLCALLALAVFGARAQSAPGPKDPAPGWAIILAADYQGSGGKLYNSVQHDAMRAYKSLVTDWHVPPSHIVLLAEGRDIDKFVENGQFSGDVRDAQALFDSECARLGRLYKTRPREWLAQAKTGVTDADTVKSLGDFEVFLDGDRTIPIFGKPSVDNFLLARNVISRLAGENQFVALVVSTHAGPTAKLAALKQKEAGKVLPGDCLDATDLALPHCQAKTRLLLIDAGDRDPSETVTAPAQNPYPQIQHQLADHAGMTAVVMSASDGKQASWPSSSEESLFLRSVFDFFRADAVGTLGDVFNDVRERFNVSMVLTARRLRANGVATPIPAAVFYPTTDADMSTATVLNHQAETANTEPLTKLPPSAVHADRGPELIKNQAWAAVFVGNNMLMKIVGTDPDETYRRAETVAKRMQALLSADLTREDLKQIQPGQVNGYDVVLMPAKVKSPDDARYIVTADARYARLTNRRTKQLALALSGDIRNWMDQQYATRQGGDEHTEKEWFSMATAFLTKNDFAKAEESLTNAIKQAPEYVEAYLTLCDVYAKEGKKDALRATLGDLGTVVQAAHLTLTEDEQAHIKQLQDNQS